MGIKPMNLNDNHRLKSYLDHKVNNSDLNKPQKSQSGAAGPEQRKPEANSNKLNANYSARSTDGDILNISKEALDKAQNMRATNQSQFKNEQKKDDQKSNALM